MFRASQVLAVGKRHVKFVGRTIEMADKSSANTDHVRGATHRHPLPLLEVLGLLLPIPPSPTPRGAPYPANGGLHAAHPTASRCGYLGSVGCV